LPVSSSSQPSLTSQATVVPPAGRPERKARRWSAQRRRRTRVASRESPTANT